MRLQIAFFFALYALTTSCGPLGAESPKNGTTSLPNIVFFLADDLGWTGLGCFGSDLYETPHLDELARRGMRFTNAYSACTVCSPTRASVMTGMYPARLRCTDFIAGQNRPFAKLKIPDWTKRLDTSHLTIAEWLQGRGYRTGHVGKWHLSSNDRAVKGTDALSQGFEVSVQKPPGSRGNFVSSRNKPRTQPLQNADSSIEAQQQDTSKPEFITDYLTTKALDFLQQSDDRPYFLYFAYHVPHTPVVGRPDLVDSFRSKVRDGAKHTNPDFAAMVSSMDSSVGRIVEYIQQSPDSENTIIVFISDNGGLTQRYKKEEGFTDNYPLRRGKGSAYEGGVRVPAIVYWPGVTKAATSTDEPIMTIDFFPTLAAAVQPQSNDGENRSAIELPRNMDGVDLRPLLTDPKFTFDRDLFWHYPHYHAGGDGPYSAIRSAQYRLIEHHEDNRIELYDLQQDLSEQNDLSLRMPAVTNLLVNKLHSWRTSVAAQMPTANPNYDPARATQVGRAQAKNKPRSVSGSK